jgi:hypothetical protein
MHLQECGVEEKGRNTRTRSLSSPHWVGRGKVGDGRGRTTYAWMVHWNPTQSLAGLWLSFAVYFFMSPCLIRFDRDKPSWLRDVVNLGGSPLSICASTMELVTMNNHEPPMHLGLCLLRCCATKATASRSSICICDRESRSLEPSSSMILHRERMNKVFGKWSLRLLALFFKFFIMGHLPLRRTCAEGRRLQC